MKALVIVVLVCVNVGLLLALMLGPGIAPANGQAVRGAADYVAVTAAGGQGVDVLYVIDTAKRRMAIWEFDKVKKKLLAYPSVRKLKDDFGRGKEE